MSSCSEKPKTPLSTSFFLLLLQLKNHDLSTGIGGALGINKKKKRKKRGELEKKRESKDRLVPRRTATFPIRRATTDSPLRWEQVGMDLVFFLMGMNSVCWVLVCRFRSRWVVVQLLVFGLWGRFWLEWIVLGFYWFCSDWIRIVRNVLLELIGSDQTCEEEEFVGVGWRWRKEFCVKLESPKLDFNVTISRNSSLLCSSCYSKIESNKLEMLVS